MAGQIAYDGFSASFPIYANSGSGFSGPWVQGGSSVLASGYVPAAESLCFARLETDGGSISGGAFSSFNGAVRDLASPLGTDNTTVYVSFLVTPQGTLNEGLASGFFGLTLNGSFGDDLFIGKPGAGAQTHYVVENRGGSGQIPSGVPTVVGRAALMVVKAQFLAGRDIFTLYANPAPGGREPSGGAVKTDLDLGVVSKIGIYSTGAFSIDEIRIGTTYADVVPTHGEHSHRDYRDCEDRW
jgi:hypothetical protein